MDKLTMSVDTLLGSMPMTTKASTNALLGEMPATAVVPTVPELAECELDDMTTTAAPETRTEIRVDFVDVEPIVIDEIVDRHGRLSDILEALEEELHVSVIPLRMAKIAPEVTKLQRHEIFMFGKESYSFSQNIRRDVVDSILDSIVSNISSGIPFSYDLITSVMYGEQSYRTLALSRKEWTYILSRCRNYKQSLVTDMANSITLNVFAEKA